MVGAVVGAAVGVVAGEDGAGEVFTDYYFLELGLVNKSLQIKNNSFFFGSPKNICESKVLIWDLNAIK